MVLSPALGDVALEAAERSEATYTSGAVATSGLSGHVIAFVHCTAVSGTVTLDVSLEESSDGASWTAIAGSSATQLSAAGNAVIAASASKSLVRVTSTVGGESVSATYSVVALALP